MDNSDSHQLDYSNSHQLDYSDSHQLDYSDEIRRRFESSEDGVDVGEDEHGTLELIDSGTSTRCLKQWRICYAASTGVGAV